MKYCTNCGVLLRDKNNQPAFELYDEELHKKSNILKVMSCSKCGQVADKYIECDRVLLLIDLILMNKQAYRYENRKIPGIDTYFCGKCPFSKIMFVILMYFQARIIQRRLSKFDHSHGSFNSHL